MAKHKVEQGECVSSLAVKYGLLPKTLWDAQSEGLRKSRDPSALLPGDELEIPELKPREVQVKNGTRHTFRRLGVSVVVRVLLGGPGGGLGNMVFLAEVAGRKISGRTDGEGMVELAVPPDASEVKLELANGRRFQWRIGHLDPADTPSGAASRLVNLGYLAPETQADEGPAAKRAYDIALAWFQEEQELEATGELDAATAAKLVEAHGS